MSFPILKVFGGNAYSIWLFKWTWSWNDSLSLNKLNGRNTFGVAWITSSIPMPPQMCYQYSHTPDYIWIVIFCQPFNVLQPQYISNFLSLQRWKIFINYSNVYMSNCYGHILKNGFLYCFSIWGHKIVWLKCAVILMTTCFIHKCK